MTNPHIIVDASTGRCLCGTLVVGGETKHIHCSAFIWTLERAEHWAQAELDPSLRVSNEGRVAFLPPGDLLNLVAAIRECIKDCQ